MTTTVTDPAPPTSGVQLEQLSAVHHILATYPHLIGLAEIEFPHDPGRPVRVLALSAAGFAAWFVALDADTRDAHRNRTGSAYITVSADADVAEAPIRLEWMTADADTPKAASRMVSDAIDRHLAALGDAALAELGPIPPMRRNAEAAPAELDARTNADGARFADAESASTSDAPAEQADDENTTVMA